MTIPAAQHPPIGAGPHEVPAPALCAAPPDELAATCAYFVELTAADGAPPRRLRLLPAAGAVTPNDGREPWTVQDAAAVVARSLATAPHGLLAIDYDHAADLAAPQGGSAPAAGWITALRVTPEGIEADVDWTPAGARAIADKEYRFISPSFRHTPDRQVTRLVGAGLTNRPALSDLPALAHQHGHSMDPILAALLSALGLSPGADQATAVAAVTSLQATKTAASSLTALCAAAGLDAGATPEQAATAVAALKAVAGHIPAIASAAGLPETATPDQIAGAVRTLKANASAATLMETQVATLSARIQSLEGVKLAEAVDAAIVAGKFTPAQRAELLAVASENKPRFDRLVATAATVVRSGEQIAGGGPIGDGGLTAEQRAVCSAMGLSEADYKKSLAVQAGKEG